MRGAQSMSTNCTKSIANRHSVKAKNKTNQQARYNSRVQMNDVQNRMISSTIRIDIDKLLLERVA